jgi:hypothetical protein
MVKGWISSAKLKLSLKFAYVRSMFGVNDADVNFLRRKLRKRRHMTWDSINH